MKIIIDEYEFEALFEAKKSPATCAAFRNAMPFESRVVHVRWSGEAVWVPLGDMDFAVGYEDATAYPAPGQILLYSKGKSETEILIAYGSVHFASKAGTLAGNHFATITSDLDKLREIGVATLWEGARPIRFGD
ncbi:MAG: DUF3830 family protein [Gammaproteobacteria bacterium]|nr:DUF3830 family protein [Gammaproteobacteria bacterium]MDH3534415.1 DUF3830 family protein [Gammaproteobacteria bacterium]